jgi:hypothetical protein
VRLGSAGVLIAPVESLILDAYALFIVAALAPCWSATSP